MQHSSAVIFFLILDNLLRRVEGQGLKKFWLCTGRLEVVVLFGMLNLAAQLCWSRIVSSLNSRTRLKPETMTVTFDFSPTHDFFDHKRNWDFYVLPRAATSSLGTLPLFLSALHLRAI